MAEEEYVFEHDEKQEQKSKLSGFMDFLWNSDTKEFCGRDGASWAKVSLFYAVFYTLLGGFFVGMLAVFMQIMPVDKPTYYGEASSMAMANKKLNPGLGFRPQIDVEDHVIKYNPEVNVDPFNGMQKFKRNLEIYLDAKYKAGEDENLIDCATNSTYENEFNRGKSCKFNYEKIFESTNCTMSNDFGYKTPSPCVLIKLNKIVSWKPVTDKSYVSIRCEGENAYDKDNIKSITYHSEDSLNDNKEGRLDNKYFPFLAQKNYRAPFVWVQFSVNSNVVINIECKAYANNIDNEDRMNRRGQTRFTLYVSSKN